MKKFAIVSLGLFLVLLTAGLADAGLVYLNNVSFETGDLTGWITTGDGTAAVTETAVLGSKTYTPESGAGRYFLHMTAAGGESISVSQSFSLGEEDWFSITGWSGLLSATNNQQDSSSVMQVSVTGEREYLWSATRSTNGWVGWDWALYGPGTYTFEFRLANNGTVQAQSVGDTPVPIPASALLLASGLIGLVAIRRRKGREGIANRESGIGNRKR